MAKILAIRFSAIGDVAMTIPVIYSLATQYPQHEFIVLSKMHLEPMFSMLPSNVSFFAADFKGENKGIKGIYRLSKAIRAAKVDYVADLHNVLRTKILRFFLAFTRIKAAVIDKGREGKEKLARRNHKVLLQQKSSFVRYADVFEELGFPVTFNFISIYGNSKGDFSLIESLVPQKEKDTKWIGIAPFAKHVGKIYPLPLQEKVIEYFSNKPGIKVLLFGGGEVEKDVFNQWEKKYAGVISMAGKLNLSKELNLMSHLDIMLSMDSANMHMASLVNTPVVSIWGATHPYAGFMGWNQPMENAVQLHMYCRPCSIYGKKECYRKDCPYACMNDIAPQQVIQKIEAIIF